MSAAKKLVGGATTPFGRVTVDPSRVTVMNESFTVSSVGMPLKLGSRIDIVKMSGNGVSALFVNVAKNVRSAPALNPWITALKVGSLSVRLKPAGRLPVPPPNYRGAPDAEPR